MAVLAPYSPSLRVLLLLAAAAALAAALTPLVVHASSSSSSSSSPSEWGDDSLYEDNPLSMGYETPPPDEIAAHVHYKPPHPRLLKQNEEWREAAQRRLEEHQWEQYEQLHKQVQRRKAMERAGHFAPSSTSGSSSSSSGGSGGLSGRLDRSNGRRLLQSSNDAEVKPASPPPPESSVEIPPSVDDGDDNVSPADPALPDGPDLLDIDQFDEVEEELLANRALQRADPIPDPETAPAVVIEAANNGTSASVGSRPLYSATFGIALKHRPTGRWYTWVNNNNWWWGADDWSTRFWSCRYKAPDVNGFDCAKDRTCPGCDKCRGSHCYGTQNTWWYGGTSKTFRDTFECAYRPTSCGVSCKIGWSSDIGYPGNSKCI